MGRADRGLHAASQHVVLASLAPLDQMSGTCYVCKRLSPRGPCRRSAEALSRQLVSAQSYSQLMALEVRVVGVPMCPCTCRLILDVACLPACLTSGPAVIGFVGRRHPAAPAPQLLVRGTA